MNEDTTKKRGSEETPAEESITAAGEGPALDSSDSDDSNGTPAAEETASISAGGGDPIETETAQEPAAGGEAGSDTGEPQTARKRKGSAKEPRDAAQAADADATRMRWYVLHTYSGREAKVRDTIERLIRSSGMEDSFGKVLVAIEEVAEMKKGKKTVSKRKLFPSYILIEMEMTDETWSLVENVPGVTHFVSGGNRPVPIPTKDVDRILGRMEKTEGIIPEVPFTIGEHVSVIDGPFSEFTGIVDEITPEKGKLKVLVSIFGRETPVELDFLQVKPI